LNCLLTAEAAENAERRREKGFTTEITESTEEEDWDNKTGHSFLCSSPLSFLLPSLFSSVASVISVVKPCFAVAFPLCVLCAHCG
jgi:hypothetical protein